MGALAVSGLWVSIAGAPILEDVSLEAPAGSVCGLMGRNGAGKTTFMRAVMGLLRIRAGSMTFAGRDLAALPAQARAGLGIGYMPEDRRLIPALGVRETDLPQIIAAARWERIAQHPNPPTRAELGEMLRGIV